MSIEPDWAARIIALEQRVIDQSTIIVNLQSTISDLIQKNNQLIVETTSVLTTVNKNSTAIATLETAVDANRTNINSNTRVINSFYGNATGAANFQIEISKFQGTTYGSGWNSIYKAPVDCVIKLQIALGPTTIPFTQGMVKVGTGDVVTVTLGEFVETGEAWGYVLLAYVPYNTDVYIYERNVRYGGVAYKTVLSA